MVLRDSWKSNTKYSQKFLTYLSHLAFAAIFAASDRAFFVIPFALAFPPLSPPSLPSATAAGTAARRRVQIRRMVRMMVL